MTTSNKAADLAAQALRQLSDDLARGNSEALQRYLDTMARFHHYSFYNCLLILLQKPDATQVAGFNRWKELGRFVRKGEKGIAILAPSIRKRKQDEDQETENDDAEDRIVTRFLTVHVFDASQTDGEPLPDIGQTTGEVGCYLTRLRDLVLEKGIGLAFADNLGGALGVSHGGSITILRGMTPAQEFSTLVHELAHELLHRGERRIETTRQIRELEAEAVAYVVSQACGLDKSTSSWDYIRLYGGDEKLLSQSMSFVQTVASEMLGLLLL